MKLIDVNYTISIEDDFDKSSVKITYLYDEHTGSYITYAIDDRLVVFNDVIETIDNKVF
jgi:hypothetical protein